MKQKILLEISTAYFVVLALSVSFVPEIFGLDVSGDMLKRSLIAILFFVAGIATFFVSRRNESSSSIHLLISFFIFLFTSLSLFGLIGIVSGYNISHPLLFSVDGLFLVIHTSFATAFFFVRKQLQ